MTLPPPQATPPDSMAQRAIGALLLAGVYFATGKLGLFLAIPPGFATAVWPPAGIALAGLLLLGPGAWWGVWIGSFAVNLNLSAGSPTGTEPSAYLVPASIALGSSLQALVGSQLVRRTLDWPVTLDREREILRFMVLAGPVACLTGSTWGVSTLMGAGVLRGPEVLVNWWTWWFGDSLGVLVFAPLGLMAFGEPRDFWRRRCWTVGLPLLVTFSFMSAFFIYVRQREWDRLTGGYERQVGELERRIHGGMEGYMHSLQATAAFFHSSRSVDRAEFRAFTQHLLSQHAGMLALEWAPVLALDQIPAFERAMRADGLPRFQVWELDAHAKPMAALPRPTYVPLAYIEPQRGNEQAFGFDLASEPDRRDALQRARALETVQATPSLDLVKGHGRRDGFLFVLPIYAGREAAKGPTGYVAAVFGTEEALTSLLLKPPPGFEGFRLQILEEGHRQVCAFRAEGTRWIPVRDALVPPGELHWRRPLPVAGQTLTLLAFPDPSRSTNTRNWEAWTVLAAGVLFTGLLGSMLLITTGRTRVIESLVEERTKALTQSQAQLLRESRLLAQTQSAARVGGWELDLGTGELYWSTETYRIHELEPGAPVPTLENAVAFLSPEGAVTLASALQAARREGRAFEVESELHTAQQHLVWVQVTGQAVLEKGHPVKLFGAYQDISHRKQADQLKNEFISVVSHELRTPLTALKGSLGLLKGAGTDLGAPQAAELLSIAHTHTDRLGAIVDDLLDMGKIASGRLTLETLSVDLPALARGLLRESEGLAAQHGIAFRLQAPAHLPRIWGDPQRIVQVLSNLLSNAAKFSPKGWEVTVVLEATPGFLRTRVVDRGPGIPLAFRERLFLPFSQADSSDRRAKGGTGLGLSICKALVERMGGRIGFESTLGEGSTFWFELPVDPAGP